MSYAGITRRMDPLGRIVIPSENRKALGWKEDTPIAIMAWGEYILLKAVRDVERDLSADRPPADNPVALEIRDLLDELTPSDLLVLLELTRHLAARKKPLV